MSNILLIQILICVGLSAGLLVSGIVAVAKRRSKKQS